jgi:3'-phosphoadenosine 5'-phosphosulfate sulfotransferase (PAPS reductase)/FAD synthetase
MSKTAQRYLNPSEKRKAYGCPVNLRYQFTKEFVLKVSNRCCFELKKIPVHKWQKENNRTITITGMRKEEGGTRNKLTCIITDDKGKVTHFHPLAVVNDEWEDWFIKENNIQLCDLYLPPFNFKRTGCAGCPFNLNLQEDLETMERLLPNERRRCELIWKPVYEEYRRIGYRLKKYSQLNLLEE